MVFIAVVFSVSLLFVPAVAATTGADAFEIIYQQFTIVWNKAWLLVCYEAMLLLIKLNFRADLGILLPRWLFHRDAPDAPLPYRGDAAIHGLRELMARWGYRKGSNTALYE